MSAAQDTARAVLDRYGTTYADAAGIRLTDEPAPLFQLLVLAELLSARIGADIAVATAGELFARGWTTPQRMREAAAVGRDPGARPRRVPPLRRTHRDPAPGHGAARARPVRRRSPSDWPRRPTATSRTAARLLQEVKGIGPTGAAVFLREVQAVWPWVRPYLDDRARAGAPAGRPARRRRAPRRARPRRRPRPLRRGAGAHLAAARPRGSAGDRGARGCDGVTGSAPIPGGPMTAWPATEPDRGGAARRERPAGGRPPRGWTAPPRRRRLGRARRLPGGCGRRGLPRGGPPPVAQPRPARALDVAGPRAAARPPVPGAAATPCTAWSPGSPGPCSTRAPTGPRSGATLEPRPGYPFRLAAAVDYALTPDRLTVTVRVRNVGAEAGTLRRRHAPLPARRCRGGRRDRRGRATVGARTALETDGGLPTGERRPFHGDVGRIGHRALDTPLTDLERDDDGWARVRLRGPAGELELAVDGQWPWLQLYTGDQFPEGQHRRSLAVEPMTSPTERAGRPRRPRRPGAGRGVVGHLDAGLDTGGRALTCGCSSCGGSR